jgi:transcriptional regulator with XRE-family HTH domain
MPQHSRVSDEFGQAVRRAMGSLSQSETSLRCQISVGYINRMVRGSVPSPAMIVRLAKGLQVDVGPLLEAAGYKPSGSFEPPVTSRSEEAARHDNELMGPDAASLYYRELWDRYVAPIFPDASPPSGSGQLATRAGIRSRILRILGELVAEQEER